MALQWLLPAKQSCMLSGEQKKRSGLCPLLLGEEVTLYIRTAESQPFHATPTPNCLETGRAVCSSINNLGKGLGNLRQKSNCNHHCCHILLVLWEAAGGPVLSMNCLTSGMSLCSITMVFEQRAILPPRRDRQVSGS